MGDLSLLADGVPVQIGPAPNGTKLASEAPDRRSRPGASHAGDRDRRGGVELPGRRDEDGIIG